jgi:hypothetical protein
MLNAVQKSAHKAKTSPPQAVPQALSALPPPRKERFILRYSLSNPALQAKISIFRPKPLFIVHS